MARASAARANVAGRARASSLAPVEGGGEGALELDPFIHERIRLGMVSALAARSPMTFVELKAALKTTDGNLSVHARRLEETGYVECSKSFDGRVPRTEYRLTESGRRALHRYLDHMEALIRATRATR